MTEAIDPIIETLAKRLHSESLSATPITETYEAAVRALQRVLTPEEGVQFRAVWASEHAAWEALSGRTNAADASRAKEDLLEAALRGEYEHIGGDLPWPSFRLRQGAAVLRALARDADDVAEPILAADIAAVAERVEQAANADEALGRKRRDKADALLTVVERWMSQTSADTGKVVNFRQAVLVPFVCDIVGVMEGTPPSEDVKRASKEREARATKAETLLTFCERWVATCGTQTGGMTTFVADDLCRLAGEVCAAVEGAPAKTTPMYETTFVNARARELLGYVEQWCSEHEIGPYEDIPKQLRGMLATALLHFAAGVCARALPQVVVGVDPASPEKGVGAAGGAPSEPIVPPPLSPEDVKGAVSPDAPIPPPPSTPLRELATPPLPFWDGPKYISVNGHPLQVKGEDGKLDYKLLAQAMAEVAAMNLTREVRSTFNTLVFNAVAYEESRGVPLANASKPTDGNVLLAYNRCATATRGDVQRIALLVEMRNAGIGSDLKERRDYMEDMIRRGLLSLSEGGRDPLLLGSHPSAAPGSAAS